MELLQDLKSEANALSETAQRIAVLQWTHESLTDPNLAQVIRGRLAIGSPDVKQMAPIPKPGTTEYKALCAHFKFDHNTPVRFHWPSMVEHLSAMLESGRPLPPGMQDAKGYSLYRLTRLRENKRR